MNWQSINNMYEIWNNMAKYIKKARKVGGVMVITIPIDIVECMDIKEKEFLEVSLKKVNEK